VSSATSLSIELGYQVADTVLEGEEIEEKAGTFEVCFKNRVTFKSVAPLQFPAGNPRLLQVSTLLVDTRALLKGSLGSERQGFRTPPLRAVRPFGSGTAVDGGYCTMLAHVAQWSEYISS
jgi:hypothetical protein